MGSTAVLAAVSKPGQRTSFYVWLAVALSATVLVGFWFTYFGPLYRGEYPPVSPMVHVHGWSFFLWYLLLTAQVALVRSRRVAVHRALGFASVALAAVMIIVGLIVSTVRIEMSLAPNSDPFWALMGVPIFSIWVLFAFFYGAALYYRERAADHKRLMLLGSAVAASAATFRIFVQIFGFKQWVAIVGTLAPNLFLAAAMIHDYRCLQKIHRVYVWGAVAINTAIGGAFLLVLTPAGDAVKHVIAQIGRLLKPLY